MAKDIIHDAVKNALIKDGWTVTHDPLTLEYEDARVFVDLGAERVIAAEKNGQKIAIEIKSFVGRSALHDMELALGQFVLYRTFLHVREPERRMYVAISNATYLTVFQRKSLQLLIKHNHVSLIVVDIETEEVVQWIEN